MSCRIKGGRAAIAHMLNNDLQTKRNPTPLRETWAPRNCCCFFFFSTFLAGQVQKPGKQADPWVSRWDGNDVPAHVWGSHTLPENRYVTSNTFANYCRKITFKAFWVINRLCKTCCRLRGLGFWDFVLHCTWQHQTSTFHLKATETSCFHPTLQTLKI